MRLIKKLYESKKIFELFLALTEPKTQNELKKELKRSQSNLSTNLLQLIALGLVKEIKDKKPCKYKIDYNNFVNITLHKAHLTWKKLSKLSENFILKFKAAKNDKISFYNLMTSSYEKRSIRFLINMFPKYLWIEKMRNNDPDLLKEIELFYDIYFQDIILDQIFRPALMKKISQEIDREYAEEIKNNIIKIHYCTKCKKQIYEGLVKTDKYGNEIINGEKYCVCKHPNIIVKKRKIKS